MGITNNEIAIVLGSKGVNATGLIRSLGEAGYDVTFASDYSKIESKWTKEYVKLPFDEKGKIKRLLDYIKELKTPPFIFPVDDKMALMLDENHMLFDQISICPGCKGKMRWLADKWNMSNLAQKCGLAVPKQKKTTLDMLCQEEQELPIIVKPFLSVEGEKGDISICYTNNDVKISVNALREKGYEEVLVQKFLQEKGQYEVGVVGCSLRDGTIFLPCVIKKIRSYPRGRGSTSYAVVKKWIDELDYHSLQEFVRATGYSGIFDIEMIISGGNAYFIEINFRNGQYGYAATSAGCNLADAWIKGVLKKQDFSDSYNCEIYYMNEREDFKHVKNKDIRFKEWKENFKQVSAYGMFCVGDQRPFWRQYVKIPDRVKIYINKIQKRIKDLMVYEEWNIAVRPVKGTKLYEKDGEKREFHILPNSIRYWAADPFLFTYKEKDYLFFEMFDRFKGKGVIGYRIIEDGKIGKMKKAYEGGTHLSFPNIFEYNGCVYMMPESAKSKELVLLKAIEFPGKWEVAKRWLQGSKVCDSVIFQPSQEVFLLTQEFEDEYCLDCLHGYVFRNGIWEKCENFLLVQDISNARMAGNIIYSGEGTIRVAQNCEGHYGRGIKFNYIHRMTSQEYEEECFKSIEACDINISNKKSKYVGIHTYNQNSKFECIDLKCVEKIRIGNMINLGYRIWKIITRRS